MFVVNVSLGSFRLTSVCRTCCCTESLQLEPRLTLTFLNTNKVVGLHASRCLTAFCSTCTVRGEGLLTPPEKLKHLQHPLSLVTFSCFYVVLICSFIQKSRRRSIRDTIMSWRLLPLSLFLLLLPEHRPTCMSGWNTNSDGAHLHPIHWCTATTFNSHLPSYVGGGVLSNICGSW